jgi:hypothetical protein
MVAFNIDLLVHVAFEHSLVEEQERAPLRGAAAEPDENVCFAASAALINRSVRKLDAQRRRSIMTELLDQASQHAPHHHRAVPVSRCHAALRE